VVEEDRCRGTGNGERQVGIGQDDVRRLAAELQRDPLEVVGRCPHNDLADLGEPGEGDLVDVGMPGERRAGRLAEPGDDVDDAVRQAGLEQQLAEAQRRERGLLGDLEDTV